MAPATKHDDAIRHESPRKGPESKPVGVSDEPVDEDLRSGGSYDVVTMFDCLHDMGDPVGAAQHVLRTLSEDGTWMLVEQQAGNRLEVNRNPVGRAYYAFSTLLCTPSSLAQEVGLALGAQAGEARIRDVITDAGFGRFRRVAKTPFNAVFEARR